jgi:hypothetical protein
MEEPAPVVAQAVVGDEEVGTENEKLKMMEEEKAHERRQMEDPMIRTEEEKEILRRRMENAMIRTEEKKRRNKHRMHIFIFVVVVIIAGVGAYFGTRGSSTDNADGEATPTELILYDAPTPEDCEKIGAGIAIEEEDQLLERSFNMLIDIQLTVQADIQVLLLDFQERFQQVLVPDLAGCSMQNNPYVIANGIVTVGVSVDMACQVESDTCHAAVANLLLKVRGEERIFNLLGIILEVVGKIDLEEKLQLGPPFDQITVIQIYSTDETPSASPTAFPTTNPTKASSASPTGTSRPSAAPSISRCSMLEAILVDHDPLHVDAKNWLCDTDTWVPPANDFDPDRLWNERYAMAVFYYSTNGNGWNFNDGWLSSTSVCDWSMLDVTHETAPPYARKSVSPCGGSDSRVTVISVGESCLSLFSPVAQLQQVCHLT